MKPRRSASRDRDGEELPVAKSLRSVFQRKCPEELSQRRSMLAELVRQSEHRPWTGHSTSPAFERGSPQSARRTADGPLRFASHFECGNLLSAKLASKGAMPGPGATELEYELMVDADTQSPQGHTQWFYFSARNGQFCGTVHFRIANLRKKKSLYQQGLQPFVFSRKKHRTWEPNCCQGVSYRKCEGRDVNVLQWSYRFDRKEDEVFFAAYPPYSYSMMKSFVSSLEQDTAARCHLCRLELCRSIGQLPVPLLLISEDGTSTESKPAIVITARQHPGEVVGSWAVQGLLRFLLGPTPAAKRLREEFVFHVVPMVNVDGVVHGNSRCTLAGVDPNRVWHDPNPILHPVIFALKNHMRSLSQGPSTSGIEMFLDLHGHSAKFGCFFYGSNPSAHISNAVFPKLCSLVSSDIDFEQCHWRCAKSHRKTARYVVHKQFGVKYAYTIECSLFAANEGGGHFTPSRVEFVGCAVGCGLAVFFTEEGSDLKLCRQCADADTRASLCDLNLLLDLSCPNVLAKRPWLRPEQLEVTPAAILEGLMSAYGEVVPDLSKLSKDSDDGGDSDGDDGEEEERKDPVSPVRRDDRRRREAKKPSPSPEGSSAAEPAQIPKSRARSMDTRFERSDFVAFNSYSPFVRFLPEASPFDEAIRRGLDPGGDLFGGRQHLVTPLCVTGAAPVNFSALTGHRRLSQEKFGRSENEKSERATSHGVKSPKAKR